MPPKGATLVARPSVEQHNSPAAEQQRQNSAGIAEFELPKTSLVKLAKGSIPDNVKMQQDVVTALMRSSTLFINYLSARALWQVHHGVRRAQGHLRARLWARGRPHPRARARAGRSQAASSKAGKKPAAGGAARGRRRKSGVDEAGDVSMAGDGDGEDNVEVVDDDEDVEDDDADEAGAEAALGAGADADEPEGPPEADDEED